MDFVVETARRKPGSPPKVVAIEVKRVVKWNRSWEKHLRIFSAGEGVTFERMIAVNCGERRYRFEELDLLPVTDFVDELFAGKVF